ncbi:hypothetical protein GCM10010517_44160 [Streptosporangium fragile]|uniref:Uncharacterized protein n=1 Tax=Streptosporangium fragile TaxID=46186 RepID=A0ABP6IJX5_9ACTN
MRINELPAQGERLVAALGAAVAEDRELKAKLTRSEDDLTGARSALKKMTKDRNLWVAGELERPGLCSHQARFRTIHHQRQSAYEA